REFGERLILAGQLQDVLVGVAGAFEELGAAAAGDGDGQLLAGGFVKVGIGEEKSPLGAAAAARATAPTGTIAAPTFRAGSSVRAIGSGWVGADGSARIHNGRTADSAGGLEGVPALDGAAEVGFDGSGSVSGAGGVDVDGNFAAKVDA